MIIPSPACKPQATFALLTIASSASSSPSDQRPNPSPRSAFRSTDGSVADVLVPSLVAVDLAGGRRGEDIGDLPADRPGLAGTDRPVVDLGDRDQLGRRTAEECLVGVIEIGAHDALLEHLIPLIAGNRHH